MPSHERMRALLALLFVPLLAACPGPRQVVVPPEAWRCLPRPAIPEVLNSDADLAVLLVDAFEYGDDCYGRLQAVRRIVAPD